jgi:hypothetical protein
VCAGIVVAGGAATSSESARVWPSRARSIAIGGVAAAAVLVLVALLGGPSLNEAQLQMQERALDPSVPLDVFHAEIKSAMLSRPAEPYFPFIGAVRAARAKDESVVPWIGHALERSPVFGRAHLLLARWLVPLSPPQARLEYRLAMEQDSQLGAVVLELARLVGGYDDASELIPSGQGGPEVIDVLARVVADRLPATAARLDDDLRRREPRTVAPLIRAAERLNSDLYAGDAAPWCATGPEKCINAALAVAAQVADRRPGECIGPELRARARMHGSDTALAIDELEAAAERASDRTTCEKKALELALMVHDERRVTQIADRIARSGCSSDAECGENLAYLARMEEGRGNQRRALAFYKQATERSPERDDLLDARCRIASAVGLHVEALDGYETLARRHPEDTQWTAKASKERALLVQVPFRR